MAKELNIFIDNKPGRLKAVTELLSLKKINLRALTIQNRSDFGLIKCVVDKPKEAHLAVSDAGFACALKDILAVITDDKPGGLGCVLDVLFENNINLKDSYAFIVDSGKKAVFCFEVENYDNVEKILVDKGFKLMNDNELYGL